MKRTHARLLLVVGVVVALVLTGVTMLDVEMDAQPSRAASEPARASSDTRKHVDLAVDAPRAAPDAKPEHVESRPQREDASALAAGRLNGLVTSSAGPAVGGARVQLVFDDIDAGRGWVDTGVRPSYTTESDADGRFAFELPISGTAHLLLLHETHVPITVALGHVDAEAPCDGVRIVLERAPSVSGVVLSPDGVPVAGATVLVEDLDAPEGAQVFHSSRDTDSFGRFEVVGLARGAHALSCTFRPGATLTAQERALEAKVGRFLETRADTVEPSIALGAPADTSRAKMPAGSESEWQGSITVQAGECEDVVLRLSRGGTITGRVVWSGTTRAPGTRVRAGRRAAPHAGQPDTTLRDVQSIDVADDGRFTCADLAPGRWTFLATADESNHSLTVTRDVSVDCSPIELVLEREASVGGVVRGSRGAGSLHGEVQLECELEVGALHLGHCARIDEQGRFRIACPPGVCRLRAHVAGVGTSAPIELDLHPGEERRDVVIDVPENGQRLETGRARTAQGRR